MSPGNCYVSSRSRSTVEIAFRVVKTLATARILWPSAAEVTVEDLAAITAVSVEDAGMAVALLRAEGILADARGSSVRLSDLTAAELFGPGFDERVEDGSIAKPTLQ